MGNGHFRARLKKPWKIWTLILRLKLYDFLGLAHRPIWRTWKSCEDLFLRACCSSGVYHVAVSIEEYKWKEVCICSTKACTKSWVEEHPLNEDRSLKRNLAILDGSPNQSVLSLLINNDVLNKICNTRKSSQRYYEEWPNTDHEYML